MFITKWGSFFLLQSEANCVTKWGSSFITKWGRFYYKVEQVLQSGASFITKWGRYYKVGHYYKVVHNNCLTSLGLVRKRIPAIQNGQKTRWGRKSIQ